MRVAVLTKLNHDPAPPHLVRDGARRSRTSKRVKNQIAGIGAPLNHCSQQTFGLRKREFLIGSKEAHTLVCPMLRVVPGDNAYGFPTALFSGGVS